MMRTHKASRKALAVFLAAVLALSMGGLAPAYGAEAASDAPSAEAGVAPQEVYGGNCGAAGNESNVTWSFDSNTATLTIDGTGAMKDLDSYSWPPWDNHKTTIEHVVISQGVTSIGANAFSAHFALTSVEILTSVEEPAVVVSVGDSAFSGCVLLVAVEIPEGVVSIGASAFKECPQLSFVDIPSSVQTIGDSAFSGCGVLASVAIPSGVQSIEDSTFFGCASLEDVVIPSSVQTIGDSAFSGCAKLASVTIPSGVLSIGDNAFNGCSVLGSVDIPSSVQTIGDYAFLNCSALDSADIREGVLSIGAGAFSTCTLLRSVVIPSSVASIGASAFNNCTASLRCEALSQPSGWDENWLSGYVGEPEWGYGADIEPPVLSAASALRLSAGSARVSLTSSEGGSWYYAIVAPGAPAPVIGTAGAGTSLAAGPQALEVGGLATGAAWDVCLVAKDAAGNLSSVIRVGVSAWEYTVTFWGWGDVVIGASQKVAYGKAAKAPTAPPHTGYTVKGWDKAFGNVTSDLIVTAQYEINRYTVTFKDWDGTVLDTQTDVAYGTAAAPSSVPRRTGHTFMNWGRALTNVTSSFTVTAQYKANDYAVTFNANGGKVVGKASASVTRPYRAAFGKLPTPARTGYTFQGWFTGKAGGQKVGPTTKVTKAVTYYAHWKVKSYTVRLDPNGGRLAAKAASLTKQHNQALGKLKAKPTRTGYTFQGWFTGKVKGTQPKATAKVTKNVTYYAHWKANGPVVTLNANGGKVGNAKSASVVKSKDKAVGRLATPKRSGYSFQGWFTGKVKGTKVTARTKVTKSVTLYAHWKRVR
jgi:uncharacterized repeat protein (TIGR02543 family)